MPTSSRRKIENILADYQKDLGAALRAERNAQKMSLKGAEAAGFPDFKHLQKIEKGELNINLKTLISISMALGYEPRELLKHAHLKT